MERRRFFTLIELFLALSILAVLGGFVLVKTKPLLDHYRFSQGVNRLREEIDLSRRLSHIASADITLHITEREKGLLVLRETDEPLSLPRTINQTFLIPHLSLKEKDVEITFTATGWVKEEVNLTPQFKGRSVSLSPINNNVSKSEHCSRGGA